MAQLERTQRHVDTGKTSVNPTVEQLLRGSEVSKMSPTSSSSSPSSPYFERMKHHDPEEDHSHHQKKSVLTKVKEKAKKLRHSLSKKRHDDANVAPSWGVTLEEDDEEEDPEYLGAPMYESELAPEAYRENARQHPRATPVISEKHVLPTTAKPGVEQERERTIAPSTRRTTPNTTTNSPSPKQRMTETVTEKLGPVYTTRSDAADSIATKIQGIGISGSAKCQSPSATASAAKFQGIAVSKPSEHQNYSAPARAAKRAPSTFSAPNTPTGTKMASQSLSGATVVPRTSSSAPVTPQTSSALLKSTSPTDQIWDKGVSVKEYLLNKFEPGEDEKALSQVISEAMSPRRTPGDVGVMEKVREAVTSLLRNEEPSKCAVKSPASTIPSSTSSQVPVSTTVHEVDQDENHGRILQTN
ncbi:hypothetical protein L6164_021836 [Bauhinia variegata]|uniref:Uncharacterized protein n=1 Tax=Bauhinia variegata TaxID=167791 RepID=A0ACB9MDM5_BAUVA|nr:hypothetical protein L6164_021836 [Bauhinia variegata]